MNPSPLLLSFTCAVLTAGAQGTFQNLNFEAANLTPVPPGQFGGSASISNALPFWTGYLGTNQVTQVFHNNVSLGGPSIDIFGPNWTNDPIIEGLYTAVLQPGVSPPIRQFRPRLPRRDWCPCLPSPYK